MVQNRNNIDLEIILLLIKGENHLRNIARGLKVPHSTILRRLDNLVRENVLDFKIQGKNKVFFMKKNLQTKNYVFNAERYKLIKLLKEYPELSVIIEDIMKKVNQKMIILFGSYAKFTAKKDSDIDIYIETGKKSIKENTEAINSKIKVKIGEFDTKSLLIREIIKHHVILKNVENFYEKTGFFE